MNLKDLEFKINQEITNKNIDTEYKYLYHCIENVKDIIKELLKDEIKNNQIFITDYKSNIIIKYYDTKSELVIKLKKKRSKEEYRIGVLGWAYQYIIEKVVINDDKFKTLDEFINYNKEVINTRINKNADFKAKFDEKIAKYGINYKEFNEILDIFNSLNYETRKNIEEEK